MLKNVTIHQKFEERKWLRVLNVPRQQIKKGHARIFKTSFPKAKLRFEQVQIGSSASVIAMYIVFSNKIVTEIPRY